MQDIVLNQESKVKKPFIKLVNTLKGGIHMNELIKVNYDSDRPTILGRDLHEFLEVKTKYADWFPRMCEYGFIENIYFSTCFSNLRSEIHGGQNKQDHQLTIDMAKEICMLQRSEKGKIARQYFIQLEKAWNTPEMIMSRALKMAEKQLKQLQIVNAELTVNNQIMKPKADYFDELVERGLDTGIRETAKELHIGERKFVRFLIKKKYLYRDKKGKLQPYSNYVGDLFTLKECFDEDAGWKWLQLFVTPKGKETFKELYLAAL